MTLKRNSTNLLSIYKQRLLSTAVHTEDIEEDQGIKMMEVEVTTDTMESVDTSFYLQSHKSPEDMKKKSKILVQDLEINQSNQFTNILNATAKVENFDGEVESGGQVCQNFTHDDDLFA